MGNCPCGVGPCGDSPAPQVRAPRSDSPALGEGHADGRVGSEGEREREALAESREGEHGNGVSSHVSRGRVSWRIRGRVLLPDLGRAPRSWVRMRCAERRSLFTPAAPPHPGTHPRHTHKPPPPRVATAQPAGPGRSRPRRRRRRRRRPRRSCGAGPSQRCLVIPCKASRVRVKLIVPV